MPPLADQIARDRIRQDLDATLIVEAAAGTGKTSEMVTRIVSVIAAGHRQATLGSIIAVTFTERAAGEMKLRLRQALENARVAAPVGSVESERLRAAVAALEVAHIGTTHGVCADLLREYPIAAGVDPRFTVAIQDESFALLDQAFDAWFQRALIDPPEGVRRMLRRRGRFNDDPPRERLRNAARRLVEHRDFNAPWRRDPFDRNAALDALVPRCRALAGWAASGEAKDPLAQNLVEVRRFIEDLDHAENVVARDHDGLEASIAQLGRHWSWARNGRGQLYAKGLPRAQVVSARDALKAAIDDALAQCDADLAACLHRELLPIIDDYETVKARAGALDFFDLQLKVRELLQRDGPVRHILQTRFTHLFIDEFQDTDPLQADIVRLLAASDPGETNAERAGIVAGKLFIVGDPKQAIYGFRRADVTVYERVKSKMVSGGAEVVHLTTSFRGDPAIQDAVNAAFAPVMGQGTQTQARYVPLTPFRPRVPTQPALVALPVPKPYSRYGFVTNQAIDASYPDAVAAWVEFLVKQSGWTVVEPGSEERVPVQPRHICILFRRFSAWGGDVTLRYARGLENRNIPHVLVGGRSFHVREEIHALRNALTAIEWPDDELSVYATLKGPFFALPDEALLVFKSSHGTLHPLKRFADSELDPMSKDVVAALAVIKGLHFARNRTPIADTLTQLLEATRAHAGLAFWTAGDRALANVAQLADLARQFEAGGASSFRAFVNKLHDDAALGEGAEAPLVEEGTEGVRMMTVHKAKGLEFPVVILADPTAPAGGRTADRWVDSDARLWAERLAGCAPIELLEHQEEALRREREEIVRLAYVAATRARDLLVVPVLGVEPNGDDRRETWLDFLAPALFPADDERQTRRPAPGCPEFSAESVVERSDREPNAVCVAPGLHRPKVGEHPVVWWDPNALVLDVTRSGGLHHHEVLQDDPGGTHAAGGRAAYEAWRAGRERTLAEGQKPSVQVLAAREVRRPASIEVEHQTTGINREGRPRGRRFGELVHLSLSTIPLQASHPQVVETVSNHAHALAAPDEELRSAVTAVWSALEHPLLQAAARSAQVRRESPVLIRLEDGSIAEGVADLAYRDERGWVVIDFKTADELAEQRGAQEDQVSIYVQAIAAATKLPTRGILLSV